jgi:hypothetical protein
MSGNSHDRRIEQRLVERVVQTLNLNPKKSKKPIDSWLTLVGIAVGIVFSFSAKTPSVIIGGLLLCFVVLAHPIWNFWWVERSLARRIAVLFIVAIALLGIGFGTWPEPSPIVLPIIQMRCILEPLGIIVPAGSEVFIIKLREDLTAESMTQIGGASASHNGLSEMKSP